MSKPTKTRKLRLTKAELIEMLNRLYETCKVVDVMTLTRSTQVIVFVLEVEDLEE